MSAPEAVGRDDDELVAFVQLQLCHIRGDNHWVAAEMHSVRKLLVPLIVSAVRAASPSILAIRQLSGS